MRVIRVLSRVGVPSTVESAQLPAPPAATAGNVAEFCGLSRVAH